MRLGVALVQMSIFVPAVSFAKAGSSKKIEELKLYTTTLQHPWKTHSYLSGDFRESADFFHPHKVVNKEEKEARFVGLSLASLVNAYFPKSERSAKYVLVSTDSYTIELSHAEMAHSGAMIGLKYNDEKMPWRRGLPGLLFPTAIKDPKSKFQEQSWWGWWVTALIAGQPKSLVDIDGKKIDLSKCAHTKSRRLAYPRGRREPTKWKDKTVPVTGCVLSNLIKAEGDRPLRISVDTAYGQTVRLADDPKDVFLPMRVDGQPIPASYGGPVHLCSPGTKAECVYFIKGIRTEK